MQRIVNEFKATRKPYTLNRTGLHGKIRIQIRIWRVSQPSNPTALYQLADDQQRFEASIYIVLRGYSGAPGIPIPGGRTSAADLLLYLLCHRREEAGRLRSSQGAELNHAPV